jgi:hypothetical protein
MRRLSLLGYRAASQIVGTRRFDATVAPLSPPTAAPGDDEVDAQHERYSTIQVLGQLASNRLNHRDATRVLLQRYAGVELKAVQHLLEVTGTLEPPSSWMPGNQPAPRRPLTVRERLERIVDFNQLQQDQIATAIAQAYEGREDELAAHLQRVANGGGRTPVERQQRAADIWKAEAQAAPATPQQAQPAQLAQPAQPATQSTPAKPAAQPEQPQQRSPPAAILNSALKRVAATPPSSEQADTPERDVDNLLTLGTLGARVQRVPASFDADVADPPKRPVGRPVATVVGDASPAEYTALIRQLAAVNVATLKPVVAELDGMIRRFDNTLAEVAAKQMQMAADRALVVALVDALRGASTGSDTTSANGHDVSDRAAVPPERGQERQSPTEARAEAAHVYRTAAAPPRQENHASVAAHFDFKKILEKQGKKMKNK